MVMVDKNLSKNEREYKSSENRINLSFPAGWMGMIKTWNLIQSPPGFLEQGTKSISGNTFFVENAPWRKLIARKRKWACTFNGSMVRHI